MSDDGKRQAEIYRAAKAKEIFRNEIFAEAVDHLRNRYKNEWAASSVDDLSGRERLYFLMQALEEFYGHLKSVIETGAMAEDEVHRQSMR
jgi:hypothetical protein